MRGSLIVPLMMFGWILIAMFLVVRLRPVRGIAATIIGAWLFLPVATYKFEGFPPYSKVSAATLSALIAALVFDSARVCSFRPRLIDLPMVVWCLSPGLSSLVNGLGPMDATDTVIDQLVMWGFPYLLGRVYFATPDAMRELASGVVVGGMIYAPLCLYEIVMSPQLHTIVYGYYPHQFLQSKRFGGWRPSVFMQHGLAVGLFMCSAALAAWWLWRSKAVRSLFGVPIAWVTIGLVVVAVMCKSMGSIALLIVALAAMWSSRALRWRLPLIVLVLLAPLYMSLRTSGMWSGEQLVTLTDSVEESRGDSLESRLNSENIIVAHALRQPALGWGGWGRNMVDDEGRDLAIMDGFWIIVISKWGLVGLAAMTAALLGPALRVIQATSKTLLAAAAHAPALAMAALVCMFVIDCLFNAMINPMYAAAAGGLAGLTWLRAGASVGRRTAAAPAASASIAPPDRVPRVRR